MTNKRPFTWCVSFVCLLWAGFALAQEEKAKATPEATKTEEKVAEKGAESKDDAPAASDKKDAAEKPAAEGTPAAAGPAMQEFNTLSVQWKEIIKDLRRLKTGYTKSTPEQAGELEQKWRDLISQGNAIIPKIRAAAQKAYVDEKSNDPQLQRFLLKLVNDAVQTDDYEVGADLALAMLARYENESAPPPKELYNSAGICKYALNDYDAAKKYFELAEKSNSLRSEGERYFKNIENAKKNWEKELEVREKEKTENDLPQVKLTTTAGDITLELFENQAPDTVGNFISLVESDFYKGVTFHRVLEHFMAQGGCPRGDGTGDAGYKIYCETDKPDFRRHFRGSLSMAHAGKDTGGSQFFICFTPQESLDGKHTVFGRVIDGWGTLAQIEKVDPQHPTGAERTKILKAEVIRKRDHKYLPRKVE